MQATVPFFALLAFLLLADRSGAAVCGLAAAAFHEGGHLLAMAGCGCPPKRIRFTAFGAEIQTGNGADSYGQDALIAAAGPAANFVLWIGAVYWAACFGVSLPVRLFGLSNALLAVFNLLPVEPLDGGQALFSLLSVFLKREQARRIIRLISFFTLVPVAALGFLILFRSRWNLTLLLAALYLLFLLLMKKDRYL